MNHGFAWLVPRPATRFLQGWVCLVLCLVFLAESGVRAADIAYDDLAPILADRCVMCHSGESAPLGLSLDGLDGLLKGSARGAVVKAGDPAGSELVRRLKGASQPRMPLTGPPFLSDPEIRLFEHWIEAGMPAGRGSGTPSPAPARAEPPMPDGPPAYGRVAPVLTGRCAKCHMDNGLMGPAPEGYRLTTHAATLSASDRQRVVPGNPAASELARRIRGQARPRMPHDGPPYLSDSEIGLILDWIGQGARDEAGRPAAAQPNARVRLHGTLRQNNHLDELPLVVNGETRFDKSPRPGDYVEVRGRLLPDGRVLAERIRPR